MIVMMLTVTMLIVMLIMLLIRNDAAVSAPAESYLHQRAVGGIRDLFGSSISVLINAIPQGPNSTNKDDIVMFVV